MTTPVPSSLSGGDGAGDADSHPNRGALAAVVVIVLCVVVASAVWYRRRQASLVQQYEQLAAEDDAWRGGNLEADVQGDK